MYHHITNQIHNRPRTGSQSKNVKHEFFLFSILNLHQIYVSVSTSSSSPVKVRNTASRHTLGLSAHQLPPSPTGPLRSSRPGKRQIRTKVTSSHPLAKTLPTRTMAASAHPQFKVLRDHRKTDGSVYLKGDLVYGDTTVRFFYFFIFIFGWTVASMIAALSLPLCRCGRFADNAFLPNESSWLIESCWTCRSPFFFLISINFLPTPVFVLIH